MRYEIRECLQKGLENTDLTNVEEWFDEENAEIFIEEIELSKIHIDDTRKDILPLACETGSIKLTKYIMKKYPAAIKPITLQFADGSIGIKPLEFMAENWETLQILL